MVDRLTDTEVAGLDRPCTTLTIIIHRVITDLHGDIMAPVRDIRLQDQDIMAFARLPTTPDHERIYTIVREETVVCVPAFPTVIWAI